MKNKEVIENLSAWNITMSFLKENGFYKLEMGSMANDRCNVVFETDHYEVADNQGYVMYSNDMNIYWLVVVLTYFEYMDKNYKSWATKKI